MPRLHGKALPVIALGQLGLMSIFLSNTPHMQAQALDLLVYCRVCYYNAKLTSTSTQVGLPTVTGTSKVFEFLMGMTYATPDPFLMNTIYKTIYSWGQ